MSWVSGASGSVPDWAMPALYRLQCRPPKGKGNMDERSRVWGTYRFGVLSLISWLASVAMLRPGVAGDQASAPLLVSGTVVDDRTGLPIPDFTVTYGDN